MSYELIVNKIYELNSRVQLLSCTGVPAHEVRWVDGWLQNEPLYLPTNKLQHLCRMRSKYGARGHPTKIAEHGSKHWQFRSFQLAES